MDKHANRSLIKIMGIVNLTNDSYFQESRCLNDHGKVDEKKLLERLSTMIDEGVDILDIGACSTRPFSHPVGEKEEWERLKVALPIIKTNFPAVRLSIDSYFSSVVEKSFELIGDFIVNDISAGEDDKDMLSVVAKYSLEYVAMHKRGDSMTMQSRCSYDNVTEDIVQYFKEFSIRAENIGLKNWILDPGFGFAKTIEQNYELLRNLDSFKEFKKKILVGVSRKSMLYKLFGIKPEDCLPATQVLHFAALQKGSMILRVHDVGEAKRTVELFSRIC